VLDLRDGQRHHARVWRWRLIGRDWRRRSGIGAVVQHRGGEPARRFLVDFYRESGVRQEAAVVEVGGLDQGVGLEGAS